jgi:sterol desaturase/sphingolipid hydroxylase (fatty acid hydroxylase superfamily)
MLYTINFVLMSVVLTRSTAWIIAPAVEWAGGPILSFDFGDAPWSELLYGLSFLFIFDFFYYWFHRLQHSSRILWAQHKLHHAEESLNVTTGNRHHWLEDWLRIFVILIPMQWLIELKVGSVGLLLSTMMLWGYFIHMNLRLNFGPLTRVFAGPQLHRIHHSRFTEHQDKNFAAFFPVYDLVFGTFWHPEKAEYPSTGLISGQNMNNLVDANFGPFKDWLAMYRTRRAKA